MALNIASGSRYILTNAQSGTAADLSGVDSRTVIGYGKHGGENQQWEILYNGDGWHIRSVLNGKFLALEGNPNEGTKVIADERPFTWHLWPDTKDIRAARIAVPSTDLVVDLANNGSSEPGTPIQAARRREGKHQVWKLVQV
ncbi:hypothetical protein D9613_009519 [Agrocybe pediades]|uniref:Ricin B lectin domain-containing protein n=1 Tax=Agrocybe pediades TaxID=84607 RepID=A0A8H4R560_9AGAR|nr:hypothetical protein D9613_009519 [Agrocybe pediades]